MQILPEADVAELLGRLVEAEVPGGRGFGAWGSLLRAHATLVRRLDTDLERETGLALAAFAVLSTNWTSNAGLLLASPRRVAHLGSDPAPRRTPRRPRQAADVARPANPDH